MRSLAAALALLLLSVSARADCAALDDGRAVCTIVTLEKMRTALVDAELARDTARADALRAETVADACRAAQPSPVPRWALGAAFAAGAAVVLAVVVAVR